jgi:hypothetical protein
VLVLAQAEPRPTKSRLVCALVGLCDALGALLGAMELRPTGVRRVRAILVDVAAPGSARHALVHVILLSNNAWSLSRRRASPRAPEPWGRALLRREGTQITAVMWLVKGEVRLGAVRGESREG